MASDKFYIRGGRVEWVYYNPDSDAGGQYVYNMLNAHLIENAANEADGDTTEFFDRLGASCVQYLVDVNTFGFPESEHYFNTVPGDMEDCTEETMSALMAFAREQNHGSEAAEDDEWEG